MIQACLFLQRRYGRHDLIPSHFLNKKHEISLGEAMHLCMGDGKIEGERPVLGIKAEGWLEEVFGSLTEGVKITPIGIPRGFNGTLRPYQVKGVSWLAYLHNFGLGACLADDMGLGKTIELIAFLLHEREINDNPEPTLLIAPMSILGNWQHIVLDEAQNIKNPSARQTIVIKRLKSQHRIALTGTPVEKYRNKDRADKLRQLIQPFVLRRLKTDSSIIKDLPDKVESKVYNNLTHEQGSLYEAVVKEMIEKIESSDGIERKGLVLATLTKLKQRVIRH